jgi:formylglycine-generating enzyme required for sulfatase activity
MRPYACRAGTNTPFFLGETMTTDQANYNGSNAYRSDAGDVNRQQTTDVGSFLPNAFGLYDMHGNVLEWCQDVWHENYAGAPTDSSAWIDRANTQGIPELRSVMNTRSVLRGGSWSYSLQNCRSAYRKAEPRRYFNDIIGFRLALDK